jgi:hypothetical protein
MTRLNMIATKNLRVHATIQTAWLLPKGAPGWITGLVIGLVLVLTKGPLAAADLMRITATGDGQIVTVGASSLLDLLEAAIEARDQFAGFRGFDRHLSLSYAGMRDAVTVDVTADETEAVLRIPITGFQRTFTGASSSDLQDQIEDFFKKEGYTELKRFYKRIHQLSLVAVSDGNPNSGTGLAARQAYDRFARSPGLTREEWDSPKDLRGVFSFGFMPQAGLIDAGDFSGYYVQLGLDLRFAFSQRVGLVLGLTPAMVSIEEAEAFYFDANLGLPVKVLGRAGQPLSWTLTPFGNATASGSADYVAGGLMVGGGLASLLTYDFGRVSLGMGNQISFHEGRDLKIADYHVDPGVSQQILKNGLQVSLPIGRRWVAQVYGIHTWLLQPAAIDDYFTVGGQLAYRLLGDPSSDRYRRGYLFIGVGADLAKDYTSPSVRLGNGWRF